MEVMDLLFVVILIVGPDRLPASRFRYRMCNDRYPRYT